MTKVIGLAALGWLLVGNRSIADDHYEFVPDTDRFVGLYRGNRESIGKLDHKGNFIPDPRWVDIGEGSYFMHERINLHAGPAYEFRSGRLILGEIDKEHNFIPKLDSKVIDFEDFKFSETAIRIYNLPGKFVKKKDKDSKK
jgi:hypothetical protein